MDITYEEIITIKQGMMGPTHENPIAWFVLGTRLSRRRDPITASQTIPLRLTSASGSLKNKFQLMTCGSDSTEM